MSVYRTIGPLVFLCLYSLVCVRAGWKPQNLVSHDPVHMIMSMIMSKNGRNLIDDRLEC